VTRIHDGTGSAGISTRSTGGGGRTTLTCEEAFLLLPWVAAGSAPPGERAAVYLHTATCTRCRAELAGVLALRVKVRRCAADMGPVPAGAWDRFETLVRSSGTPLPSAGVSGRPRGKPRGTRLLRQLLPWLEAAGAPALASGAVGFALNLREAGCP